MRLTGRRDSSQLGIVTMTPDDKSKSPVKPVMTHFFYKDQANPAKVRRWVGSVGPVAF
jgi:hypothetical protein